MRRPAAVFPIALALGAISLAPGAGAREEGPIEIEECQTISDPGSYKLVNNLVATGVADCLVITADFVTIDLAGFNISAAVGGGFNGIVARPASGQLQGIAVRNGSISGRFGRAVNLISADGSIVEGLRVFSANPFAGIVATGIVKGNIAMDVGGEPGVGIVATGTVTGNYVSRNHIGMAIGRGSTVIGNTASGNPLGIDVTCPANLTDNTANSFDLHDGTCHAEDNLPP